MTGQSTFGDELRRRRQLAGLSLAQFATQVHYSKSQVSKIESGTQTAQAVFVRLCDAVLKADGELIALMATATHKDESDGDDPSTGFWSLNLEPGGTGHFTPTAGPAANLGVGLHMTPGRQAVDPVAAVALFDARFQAARSLGQLVSPALSLPTLIVETHTLRGVAANTPEDSAGLWGIAARYAEYVGWMCQEAGNNQQALWWTENAVRMADRAGDTTFRPFALVRHADVALYADDGVKLVELAQRVQTDVAATARVRGLAAEREAQGHALLGNRAECLRALDRSAEWLDEAASVSATPILGTWTSQDPTLMARGWCLVELGYAAEGATLLESAIAGFLVGASRNRARWTVRAALAQATVDEMERACEIVESIAADLRQIDSA
ncbi:MAG TPA: helix-turn-helix transcriptional regulator, partial [Pseudonocardiaceae bacterium]|nr:helix-turn-helix transcriptional regulator [Pseudonocardiaceae bacterium]